MNQFQRNDRPAPDTFATPQGGSDLKSVSNSWVQRQSSILLNGYDKKLENAVNDKLNSWVQLLSDDTDKEAPKISEKTGSSSASGNALTGPAKRKQNLRFTRVNSLDYRFGEDSNFNVTADPGNTSLNYSQSFFLNTKLGFEHKTADNKTQMILKYEW